MAATAISVERVSKHYLIGHQVPQSDTLRDAMRLKLKRIAEGAARIVQGNVVSGDTIEEFAALSDISFRIEAGEVIGIIGANGAGKSTLLKILSRIVEPSQGVIRLRGRVGSLLEVGTGFHPELTGRENVFLNGAILGMTQKEIRKHFDEIVAFAEVEKFLDTPVKRYSSGMYVRLAFAVAAHLEPEIMIIDEVLAVGDYAFQQKCLGKLNSVSTQGRTVLFVSHNMLAVRSLCSRGIVLEKGHKVFDGSSEAAIEHYLHGRLAEIGNHWRRPQPVIDVGFEEIAITLIGQQPTFTLRGDIALWCNGDVPKLFLAVDIKDQLLNPIMQAIPIAEPFLDLPRGRSDQTIEIELPPLVPGRYYLDFWVGTHHNQTRDFVDQAASFEIMDSPSEGRIHPHHPNHGSIVPISRIISKENGHA